METDFYKWMIAMLILLFLSLKGYEHYSSIDKLEDANKEILIANKNLKLSNERLELINKELEDLILD